MILLKGKDWSRPYDPEKPAEEQLEGCMEVMVDYAECDPVDKFMNDIERLVGQGKVLSFSFRVFKMNGALEAASARKRSMCAAKQSIVNQIAGMLAEGHKKVDQMMLETAALCRRK